MDGANALGMACANVKNDTQASTAQLVNEISLRKGTLVFQFLSASLHE